MHTCPCWNKGPTFQKEQGGLWSRTDNLASPFLYFFFCQAETTQCFSVWSKEGRESRRCSHPPCGINRLVVKSLLLPRNTRNNSVKHVFVSNYGKYKYTHTHLLKMRNIKIYIYWPPASHPLFPRPGLETD